MMPLLRNNHSKYTYFLFHLLGFYLYVCMLFFFLIPGQNVLCALLSHSSVGHYAFFFF